MLRRSGVYDRKNIRTNRLHIRNPPYVRSYWSEHVVLFTLRCSVAAECASMYSVTVSFAHLFGSRRSRTTLLSVFQRASDDVTLHHLSRSARVSSRVRQLKTFPYGASYFSTQFFILPFHSAHCKF
jgi:hypothetical protein